MTSRALNEKETHVYVEEARRLEEAGKVIQSSRRLYTIILS